MKKILIIISLAIATASLLLVTLGEIDEITFFSIIVILFVVVAVTFIDNKPFNLNEIFDDAQHKKPIPDIKLPKQTVWANFETHDNLLIETARISYIIARKTIIDDKQRLVLPSILHAQTIMKTNNLGTDKQIKSAIITVLKLYFPSDFALLKKETKASFLDAIC